MQHTEHQVSSTVAKIMAEKRVAKRVKSTFSASLHENGSFLAHCIIVDVSMTGMKLRLESPIQMPDFLEIRTPAMPDTLKIRLAWVKGREVGVQYVADETLEEVDIAS